MIRNGVGVGRLGCVFDLQRYCLHDGPGIRTVVFLKGCSLACAWCANPESQQASPELMLGSSLCIDCGLCTQVCDRSALRIKRHRTRPPTIEIDWEACNNCLRCTEVCASGTLRQVGQWRSVDDVLTQIERDRPFFRKSGGGVSVSGGEPVQQHAFTADLLKACKDRGIHTALETNGCASWKSWAEILPFCDLVYFDLKHLDEQAHLRGTGASNQLILRNLERLAAAQSGIVVRIPLVPGYNDDRPHLVRIAELLLNLRPDIPLELIPHHRLGCFKYERLRRDGASDPYAAYSPEQLELRRAWLLDAGVSIHPLA